MKTALLPLLVVVITGVAGAAGAWLQHRRTPAEEHLTDTQAESTVQGAITTAFEALLNNLRTDYDRVTTELSILRHECQAEMVQSAIVKREMESRIDVLETTVEHCTAEIEKYRSTLSPVSAAVAAEVIEKLLAERQATT